MATTHEHDGIDLGSAATSGAVNGCVLAGLMA